MFKLNTYLTTNMFNTISGILIVTGWQYVKYESSLAKSVTSFINKL